MYTHAVHSVAYSIVYSKRLSVVCACVCALWKMVYLVAYAAGLLSLKSLKGILLLANAKLNSCNIGKTRSMLTALESHEMSLNIVYFYHQHHHNHNYHRCYCCYYHHHYYRYYYYY